MTGVFKPRRKNILYRLSLSDFTSGVWDTWHSKWDEKKALQVYNNVLQSQIVQNGFNLELWKILAQGWLSPKIIVRYWIPVQ